VIFLVDINLSKINNKNKLSIKLKKNIFNLHESSFIKPSSLNNSKHYSSISK
jgi:hypothetical protein